VLASGPSGMSDPPRPFVFRASHLDGQIVAPGEMFFFDVNLFDLRGSLVAWFVASFAQLASDGLGPHRGRAVLEGVTRVRPLPERQIVDCSGWRLDAATEPWVLDLTPDGTLVDRVRIEFETPTEIKTGGQIAARPEFAILFARVRDRLSALRSLCGDGPLPIDFRSMGERAGAVRLTRCGLQHVSVERRSGRTGRVHPLGGWVGTAEYEGNLAEFVPFLRAAEWTGVGRQAVWGKGDIRVTVPGRDPAESTPRQDNRL
jgi:hypothetical protein